MGGWTKFQNTANSLIATVDTLPYEVQSESAPSSGYNFAVSKVKFADETQEHILTAKGLERNETSLVVAITHHPLKDLDVAAAVAEDRSLLATELNDGKVDAATAAILDNAYAMLDYIHQKAEAVTAPDPKVASLLPDILVHNNKLDQGSNIQLVARPIAGPYSRF